MREEALLNLTMLGLNPYPGRGLVVGLDDTGRNLVQAYWLTGRSEGSRNRVFGADGGRVFTKLADSAKGGGDLALTLYNAMDERHSRFVVSNGRQTDTVAHGAIFSLDEALRTWTYEPDPSHTPRITAVSQILPDGRPITDMAILRKSAWSDVCDRHVYHFGTLPVGMGFCMTTYAGDGEPLPAFRGEPYLLPFFGDIDVAMDSLWFALNERNRVALAMKFIDLKTGTSTVRIKNQYQEA